MPAITSLEGEKRQRNVSVQVDGELVCIMPRKLAAEIGLRVGSEIDPGWLCGIARQENVRYALQRAGRLLEIRSRGSRELARSLKQRGFDDDVIEEAIGRLTKLGLIDDTQFAAEFIASRSRAHPQAVRLTRSELSARGVAKDDIEQAVEGIGDIDELAMARKALAKKVRELPSDKDERRKVYQRHAAFLAGRGFGWDIVKKALSEVFQAADPTEDD